MRQKTLKIKDRPGGVIEKVNKEYWSSRVRADIDWEDITRRRGGRLRRRMKRFCAQLKSRRGGINKIVLVPQKYMPNDLEWH